MNKIRDVLEFIGGIRVNGKRIGNTGYFVEHWDRYLKSIVYSQNFIKTGNLSVLEIGFSPVFLPLFTAQTGTSAGISDWVSVSVGSAFAEPGDSHENITIEEGSGVQFTVRHYTNINMERQPLPLPDNRFDVVFMLDVIEHFLFDPVFALFQIGRVMKDGGRLIVSTDNSHRLAKILQLLITGTFPAHKYRQNPYARHNHEFTKTQLSDLVTSLGFDLLDCRYANLSMHKYETGMSHYVYEIINALTLLVPRFRRHLFLCALKNRPLKMRYIHTLFKERDEYTNASPTHGS